MKRHGHNIHERFLRYIWSKQYLKTNLQTADGQPLKVLNVGQLNIDSGPDFLNARIKIDGILYVGDVEIHQTVFDWIRHQHQEDPRYNKVILHVVLEVTTIAPPTLVQSGRKVPLLVLGHFLSESIHTIWQKAILDERAGRQKFIRCYEKNNIVSSDIIEHWLRKLAVERLEIKLRHFEERLKQLAYEQRMTLHDRQHTYGELPLEGEYDEIPPPFPGLTQKDFSNKELWDQILYEGVMEGLGYNKNREPFLRLAQIITLRRIRTQQGFDRSTDIEALLFGTAGLIPKSSSVRSDESRKYVRQLSRKWKALRPLFRSELLHIANWQFFPTRPSNFPTLRLAAASELVHRFLTQDLFRTIIQLLKADLKPTPKEHELFKIFSVEMNDYWKHHYNFDGATLKIIAALGASRISEIVINTLLPLALLYARIFKDRSVREGAISVYRSLPASEDNSITRLVERQLLKGRLPLDNVSLQQSVIQLYKHYCIEGRCSECEIGAFLLY